MKPLHERSTWPTIGVYDIEAERWVDILLLCHVDELGNRKCFRDVGFYFDWLVTSGVDTVFAHWGGHYDARFIISEACRRGWSWTAVITGACILMLKVEVAPNRTLEFVDSARLMPDSVAKIGKTIGLPKLDVDRSHLEKISIYETAQYCFRDCDIVLRGLQEMRRALSEVGCDFAYTLASVAARWVRRSGVLDWPRLCDKNEQGKDTPSFEMLQADIYSEPAYFGGRVEVFRRGTHKGPLYYYDVRSSYPWSMLGDLPTYPLGLMPPSRSIEQSLLRCGISDATVEVEPSTYLPILPRKADGKLFFGAGRFRGKWTNIELLEAYRAGAKVEIHSQYVFEEKAFLKPFVNTFFDLRKSAIAESDDFKSYAYKILLNSLYGKLIETVERTSIIYGTDKVNAVMRDKVLGEKVELEGTKIGGVYKVTKWEEGPFRHVAAGAYVTARSRVLLWRKMNDVLKRGGKLFYCDTDSIITDIELPPEPEALGNLKLEMVLSELEVVCPKVYRCVTTDGKTIFKCKGTPVDKGVDGEKLSVDKARERWDMYLRGEAIGREGLNGFSSDLRKGKLDPSPEILSRALRVQDTKRVHLPNGDSMPVVFDA